MGGIGPPIWARGPQNGGDGNLQNDRKVPIITLFSTARRRRRPKIAFFDVFERFPHLKTQKTFKKDRFLSLGRPPQMGGGIEFFPEKWGDYPPPSPPIWVGNINTAEMEDGSSRIIKTVLQPLNSETNEL